MTLLVRDGFYTIRVDGQELMSTRQHASEERLAQLTCGGMTARTSPRVLIGGLGFGFTLRATLKTLPQDATVVVAELVPAVIAWNRNPAYGLAHEALSDPRVSVEPRDVGLVLRDGTAAFDAIMLDVDNGPVALSASRNKRLYGAKGLEIIRAALRPGGCLGVWSAGDDPRFAALMRQTGFAVEVARVRATATSGNWHTLFLGRLAQP